MRTALCSTLSIPCIIIKFYKLIMNNRSNIYNKFLLYCKQCHICYRRFTALCCDVNSRVFRHEGEAILLNNNLEHKTVPFEGSLMVSIFWGLKIKYLAFACSVKNYLHVITNAKIDSKTLLRALMLKNVSWKVAYDTVYTYCFFVFSQTMPNIELKVIQKRTG
jgi:hypothetical protein